MTSGSVGLVKGKFIIVMDYMFHSSSVIALWPGILLKGTTIDLSQGSAISFLTGVKTRL